MLWAHKHTPCVSSQSPWVGSLPSPGSVAMLDFDLGLTVSTPASGGHALQIQQPQVMHDLIYGKAK